MTTSSPLHVALLGPAATQDFAALGGAAFEGLPAGYIGAPFMATLAGGLLARGHRVTVISTCTDLPQGLREGLSRSCGALTLVYVPMRPGAWRPNGLGVGHILDLFRFERQVMQEALVRLQRSLSAALFMHEGEDVFVTFSAGVTLWRDGESLEATLSRADEALYEAKRTGRNRTCVC